MYWGDQTGNGSLLLVELYWAGGLAGSDAEASCRGRPNQTGRCEAAAGLQRSKVGIGCVSSGRTHEQPIITSYAGMGGVESRSSASLT